MFFLYFQTRDVVTRLPRLLCGSLEPVKENLRVHRIAYSKNIAYSTWAGFYAIVFTEMFSILIFFFHSGL